MGMTKGTPASSQIVFLEQRVAVLEDDNERMRAALRMLYDEMDEYQRINKLSAYNNHVMCQARAALEGPQDHMAKPLEGK